MTNNLNDREEIVRQKLSDISIEWVQKLQLKYNVLSDRDLHIIRLLVAEITTRQIALHLGLKPDSVKKAKHRIRKKLNLSADTSWNQFFAENHLKN